MRYIKTILTVCFLFLSSCGYHLQNYGDIPKWFNNVAVINVKVQHDLRPIVIEQLKSYKVNVCTNVKKADFWLILEEDKITDNITSVSSSTTPRQYQMTYAIKYKVQRANNGVDVVPSSSAVVTRQFTINSNRILGSDFEGDLLRHDMYKDAVAQIIDHIENAKYVR